MNILLNNEVRISQKDIYFEDLQGSVRKEDLQVIKEAIKRGENLIITGSVAAGKSTVLECVAREHLASNTYAKTLYTPVIQEMNLSGENILTLERFINGKHTSIEEKLIVANAFGVQVAFIEEVRSPEDCMAILSAIENGMQVVFTMHNHDVNKIEMQLRSYLGSDELLEKFISHFNHVISCNRTIAGVRSISINKL